MASYQYRIDGLQIQGQQVTIRLTKGDSPISATWEGETLHTTKAELSISLQETDDLLRTLLRNALLILWKKVDNNFSNPNLVIGKTATLDFQNNGLTVTVI